MLRGRAVRPDGPGAPLFTEPTDDPAITPDASA
jgi:hypothetical protein